MRKKFVSMVLSGIMVVSCALPVFASATIKRDNYTRQFESNWCWAATGKKQEKILLLLLTEISQDLH